MKIESLLKVVGVLGKTLDKMNINQISRISSVSLATVHRILKEMEARNEVLKSADGKNLFYKLNFSNPFVVKLCELASVEERRNFIKKDSRFFSEIVPYLKNLKCAVFFYAELKNESKAFLVLFRDKGVGKRLRVIDVDGKRINLAGISFSEFLERLERKDKFSFDMITKGIVLKGEHDYWNLLRVYFSKLQ